MNLYFKTKEPMDMFKKIRYPLSEQSCRCPFFYTEDQIQIYDHPESEFQKISTLKILQWFDKCKMLALREFFTSCAYDLFVQEVRKSVQRVRCQLRRFPCCEAEVDAFDQDLRVVLLANRWCKLEWSL